MLTRKSWRIDDTSAEQKQVVNIKVIRTCTAIKEDVRNTPFCTPKKPNETDCSPDKLEQRRILNLFFPLEHSVASLENFGSVVERAIIQYKHAR